MLGAFGNVSLLHETRCKIGWTGAINGQVFAMKSHRKFFATNAPDPPHWTLNWCFGTIRIIWAHLGPFGCLMKFGAKRAELGQKFVPRSRVRIFRNECTRSAPLDPKQTFWCISYYVGAFGTVWLPYETQCKMGRTSAKIRAMKSHRKFLQRTHPIHPIGP